MRVARYFLVRFKYVNVAFAGDGTFIVPRILTTRYAILHQPVMYVRRRAVNIALVADDIVLVEPNVLVQASFIPASFRRPLIFSPATKLRPLGPGMISIATLPPFPFTLNGIEWS